MLFIPEQNCTINSTDNWFIKTTQKFKLNKIWVKNLG